MNDRRIEYRWIGSERDRPVLVFLHEGLGCVDLWKDFPDRLASEVGLPAFLYSRAGYGRSSPVDLPRPLNYLHQEALVELPRIMKKAGIEEAILVGHSDGASIAIIHTGGVHNDLIRGLILEAPHVFVEDEAVAGLKDLKADFEHGKLRERLSRRHGSNVDCAFRGWNDAWLDPAFRSWNIEEYLPRILAPTLVIQGEDDQYASLAQVDAIKRQAGGPVTTAVLSRCRHVPHLERPDATLRAMVNFVETALNTRPSGAPAS